MGPDGVDKAQEEILREIARSLGDSGDRVQALLDELEEMDVYLASISDREDYNRVVDAFNEKRLEAVQALKNLMIHRDAVGATRHSCLLKSYPIPGKKQRR